MRLAFDIAPKRPLFSITVAAVATAAALVFPVAAAAQIRTRVLTGNTVLSRYVPTHFKPEVRSGRITGISLRQNIRQINSSGESLTIQTDDSTGKMELRYEGPFRAVLRADGKRQDGRLSIVLDTAGRLEIRTAAMRFLQLPGERLILALGSGPKQRVIQAATIWELLIGHRQDCRVHLLPILYKLRPRWNLLVTSYQIEEQLLRMAEEDVRPEYTRWGELVELLGHDSYARREAADRELRSAGRRALTFLRKLDENKLDTEQLFRIARIIRSFEGVEQSPREIAEEMRDDPSIWLAVAANDEESARRAAWAELRRLLKRPVDFDPTAEAPVREAQLQKIGKHIAGD